MSLGKGSLYVFAQETRIIYHTNYPFHELSFILVCEANIYKQREGGRELRIRLAIFSTVVGTGVVGKARANSFTISR